MAKARAALLLALAVIAIAPATAGAVTLYVSNFSNPFVSVFDLASGVPAPVTCDPATACKSNPGPAAIAVDPTASHVYVASDTNAGEMSVFTIGPGGVLAPVACDPATTCKAGKAPEGIAIDPRGRYVFVANEASQSVSIFAIGGGGALTPVACDPATTCAVPAAVGIAVDPSGTHLYVANQTLPGRISVFAIAADGSLTPLPCTPATNCQTGDQATGVAIDPSGGHLYVTNEGPDSISVFAIGAGGALTPVACDPATICKTGPDPVAVAVDPSGTHVYSSNSGGTAGGNSVSAFAIGAGGVLAPVACDPATACKTGETPDALAIEPNGARLYTSSSNGGSVSAFTIAAGGALVPIACDPATTCHTGPGPDFFSVAITPDQGPAASCVLSAPTGSFDASGSTSRDYPIASYAWDFGDGQTQTTSAPTVSHAYARPGDYTVTLTVTDAAHCSTALVFTGQTAYCNGSVKARTSRAVTISAAPAVALRGRISALRIRPSTLVAASRGPAVTVAAKRHRSTGTTISYRDSQVATTTFTVQRPRSGRRSGRKCVKPTRRNRRHRHCTRFVRAGRFTHKDSAGANRFHFTGRIRGHRLRPGRYRLRAVATTASGNGPAAFRRFRVKR